MEKKRRDAFAKAGATRAKTFTPRTIDHPLFKNISLAEALTHLSHGATGQCIMRPSTKGLDRIALTLKMTDDLYTHLEIREGGKRGGAAANLQLGSPLFVATAGEEQPLAYEDLDEVIARHVEPLADRIRALLDHRKFRSGSQLDVDSWLQDEKRKHPQLLPWAFNVSQIQVGYFVLSYSPTVSGRPRHDAIALSPKGFFLNHTLFVSVESLIKYFKTFYLDLPGGRARGASETN